MGRWGAINKKNISHILDNGLAYLKDSLKNKTIDIGTANEHYEDLRKLLYNEGRELLSMTNKVRFESRLNTIKKMIDKLS